MICTLTGPMLGGGKPSCGIVKSAFKACKTNPPSPSAVSSVTCGPQVAIGKFGQLASLIVFSRRTDWIQTDDPADIPILRWCAGVRSTLRWREWIRTSGSACDARAAKAIIAGLGRKPPSPDYLRLLSADITEGGPKQNLGTEALSPSGTGSSNPFPSSGESGELPYCAAGSFRSRTPSSLGWNGQS
jgi:hypothetical protein